MGVEIKPCAFCGGHDQIDFGMLTLHCDDCGASVSENKWNTRPLEDALRAELANLKAEIARLREAGRWVPVGERKPGANARVLLWADDDTEIGCYDNGAWWWENGPADDDAGRVTHWRELGAPEAQP